MKLLNSEILLIGLVAILVPGCQSLPVVNRYHYVEATIKDIPKLKKLEGILVMAHYHPEMGEIMMLIGEQDKVEQIIGREINPQKAINDAAWIKRIHQHYLQSRRVNNFGRGSANDSRVAFITKKRAYMIEFGVDDKDGKYTVVYGDDYESEQLAKDFQEIGLLEHEEPPDTMKVLQYLEKKDE